MGRGQTPSDLRRVVQGLPRGKRALVEINALTVSISAQAKTATRCFNWDGMSVTYFTGWKDP